MKQIWLIIEWSKETGEPRAVNMCEGDYRKARSLAIKEQKTRQGFMTVTQVMHPDSPVGMKFELIPPKEVDADE